MFYLRRAVARSLTSTPIRNTSTKIARCQVQRVAAAQVQVSRPFSQIPARFANEQAEEKIEVREEEIEQPEVVASELPSEQEHAAVSESTDDIPSDATTTSEEARGQQLAAALDSSDPKEQRSSQEDEQKQRTLFVGNLYWGVQEQDLHQKFTEHGNVISARILIDRDGRSKGYGFVEMDTVQAAKDARAAMNETIFDGRTMYVDFSASNIQPRRSARRNAPHGRADVESKTLFIGGLSYKMSDADLNELFRDIKNVLDVRVAIDRRTGQPRGFAHADFVTVDAAVAAKKSLEGRIIYGRRLTLDYALSHTDHKSSVAASEE